MNCVVCGNEFHCGMHDVAPCWCSRDFPPVMPLPVLPAGCLCPTCLAQQMAERRPGSEGPHRPVPSKD